MTRRHSITLAKSLALFAMQAGCVIPAAAAPGDLLIAEPSLQQQVSVLDAQPEGSYLLLPPVSWKPVEDFADMLTPDIEKTVEAKTIAFQDQTGIRLHFVTSPDDSTPITVQRARRLLSVSNATGSTLIFIIQFSGVHNAAVASPGLLARLQPQDLDAVLGLASTRAASLTSATQRFSAFIEESLKRLRTQLGVAESSAALIPQIAESDADKAVAPEFVAQPASSKIQEQTNGRGIEIHEYQPGDRSGRTPQIARLGELAGSLPQASPEPSVALPVTRASPPSRTIPRHSPDLWEMIMYWVCGILAIAAAAGLILRCWLHKQQRQAELATLRKGPRAAQMSAVAAPLEQTQPLRRPEMRVRIKPGDRGVRDAPLTVKPRETQARNGGTLAPRAGRAEGQLERLIASARMLEVVPTRLRLRLLNAMEKQVNRVEPEIFGAEPGKTP